MGMYGRTLDFLAGGGEIMFLLLSIALGLVSQVAKIKNLMAEMAFVVAWNVK